ncbi:MAG: hypothetical protein KatS3mg072_3039 [Meiothermus sp.]|nr:MAG: hypothetical protein KatS3mg072_3039 [Meiothermus sp.]
MMAEYIARQNIKDAHFESAGLKPGYWAGTHNAVCTLADLFGIDASGHQPRGLDSVDLTSFDYLVALDKHVAKCLKNSISQDKLVVWEIADPYGSDQSENESCARPMENELPGLEYRLTKGG